MKDTTLLKWLYIFELTAPVFYRVKAKFIRDIEEKKVFKHFENAEIPHSPMIKDFLRSKFNMGVFPFPFIIELGAGVFSVMVALFGKKAIYYFEYLFETEAVSSYTTLMKSSNADIRILAKQLCDEELPHLNYFKAKLGK